MSNKINKYMLIAFFAVMVVAFSDLALADSLEVNIQSGAYLIGDSLNASRLLLKFDLPEELTGAQIIFAELRLPVTSVIPDSSALAVYCNPLLISWDPNEVVWGDLGELPDTEIISNNGTLYATSDIGEQEAYFDITPMTWGWQEDNTTNKGLVFFTLADELPYFQYAHEDGQPWGKVKFTYTFQ